jgi:RNA polymerase sigma-70 factor (ECF subfamily)
MQVYFPYGEMKIDVIPMLRYGRAEVNLELRNSEAAASPVHGMSPGGEVEAEVVQLYRDCCACLYRYGLTLTPDRGLVQDAIQECFLRYFLVRKEGQSIESPKAWLIRVLRNHVLDVLKRADCRSRASLDEVAGLADQHQDVEDGLRHVDLIRSLSLCLTDHEAECVGLRVEGLSYIEIASALGVQQGTVGALLGRARKKVRAVLDRGKEIQD